MANYWRLRSIPELTDVPKELRYKIYVRSIKQARKDGALRWLDRTWGALTFTLTMASCILLLALTGLDWWFDSDWSPLPLAAAYFPIFITSGLVSWAPLHPWYITRTRPYIREYLTSGN